MSSLIERLERGEGLGACLGGDTAYAKAIMKEAADRIEKLEALLRECLSDYGHKSFTDRHGMADRIRTALAEKEGE